MTTPGIAANAYARLASLSNPATSLAKTVGEGNEGSAGPNFGAILRDVVGAVSAAGSKSDTQTQALVAGKANIVDVVTAVAETEVAVGTLVAVRDKMISAYEDIMKMPI